jgi:acyl dehydratase
MTMSAKSISAASLTVGDSRTEVVLENISRTQIVMYAGASGDYNPLHSDEIFVTQVAGYPTVFAHGMLSMGATGRIITDWVGNGRLTTYGVRFVNQVWPGDTLTATATVAAVREVGGQHLVDFTVNTVNQDGKSVVSGTATARIDA